MKLRRIISVFFGLLLALPLLYLTGLQVKQAYIKYSLEERMEAHLLKTLFIPKQDWQRINSREIIIDGKLFDLKSVREKGDGYLVTGVFDEEETAVVQQLDKTCKGQTTKNAALFNEAFRLLQQFFYQAADEPLPMMVLRKKLFQNPISDLPQLHKPVLLPPPQATAFDLL
ncbi:MAG TPA: hypothetical protein VM010_05535 [Chitinophagaceae bacterium]|nr:hypothetical protein [Chitinophagaceae bacterium]